jgi:argininosuccinate lyase
MTMYRMQQRVLILSLYESTTRLRDILIRQADDHREDVFAAHTHTQPAQPTTIAHYLHAVVETAGTRRGSAAGCLCNDQPKSTRRLCDYRNGIPDRSSANE